MKYEPQFDRNANKSFFFVLKYKQKKKLKFSVSKIVQLWKKKQRTRVKTLKECAGSHSNKIKNYAKNQSDELAP